MRIAIIPARGGSKRIFRKSIREFFGKPIIAHAIGTAQKSALFQRIYVSTEDAEIADVARRYGAQVLDRPKELAGDAPGTPEVMKHHANEEWCRNAGPTFMCCIYPTAVLMTAEDLQDGLTALKTYGAEFSFGACDDPVRDTGSFYWGRTSAWENGNELVGPDTLMIPVPHWRCADINSEQDWTRAQLLYEAMRRKAA